MEVDAEEHLGLVVGHLEAAHDEQRVVWRRSGLELRGPLRCERGRGRVGLDLVEQRDRLLLDAHVGQQARHDHAARLGDAAQHRVTQRIERAAEAIRANQHDQQQADAAGEQLGLLRPRERRVVDEVEVGRGEQRAADRAEAAEHPDREHEQVLRGSRIVVESWR